MPSRIKLNHNDITAQYPYILRYSVDVCVCVYLGSMHPDIMITNPEET